MTPAFRSPNSDPRKRSDQTQPVATPNNVISLQQVRQRKQLQTQRTQPRPPSETVVELSPRQPAQPLWIKSLMVVQNFCSVTTGLLVGTTLALYGMSVYTESIWSQEYQTLERFRRQEHQFRAANELLKHQIVQDADNPKASSTMDTMIFLQPALPRPEVPPEPAPYLDLGSRSGSVDRPIGY